MPALSLRPAQTWCSAPWMRNEPRSIHPSGGETRQRRAAPRWAPPTAGKAAQTVVTVGGGAGGTLGGVVVVHAMACTPPEGATQTDTGRWSAPGLASVSAL